MPAYDYWATTEIGDTVTGKISAGSPDAASRALTLRGLVVRRLEEVSVTSSPVAEPTTLSTDDFDTLAAHGELITQHKLPLVTSLRTLVEESSRPRLRQAVLQVIRQLEQGQHLDDVLGSLQSAFPRRMGPLFEAGMKTGRLPFLLQHTIDHLRSAGELRRKIWLKLTYPLCMVVVAIAICCSIIFWLVPMFERIFNDFGTDLPALTKALIGFSRLGSWGFAVIGLVLLVVVAIAGGAIKAFGGRRRVHQLIGWIPLLGTLLRAASLAGFFRMLSILIDGGFSLPEALRIAAAVNDDALLSAGVEQITADLEHGITPLEAVRVTEAFPREVLPVFRWTDKPSLFIEALHGASDIYSARAQMNSGILAVVLEPLVIFGIGISVGTIVIALFMPLIKLLNDLA